MQEQKPQKKSSYKKSVLRYLQKIQPFYYLIPTQYKQQLGYPQKCLTNPSPEEIKNLSQQLISIDCEMLLTQKGNQLCRILIVNNKYQVIYDKWFLPHNPIIDYVTHITGITEEILKQNTAAQYLEQDKNYLMKLIEGKIVVGHDLTNDLQVLDIAHSAFIDTIHICPHNFGLPYKSKLKNLAMELLRKPIQWGYHDPTEDAITTLEIVHKHLSQGKGVMVQEQIPVQKYKYPQQYKNVWEIISDSQLQKDKIAALFLRGSRALNLQLNIEGYKSDWDYVCIYKTWAKINGKLIKFPEIDITIYDLDTFNFYIHNQNDISYLEMFFLPKEYQIVNELRFPRINIQKLRQSLGFHLSKSKMKIQRFKGDPSKNWKILKTIHLKMRFMDNFLQLYQFDQIVDVKRMNSIWEEFKKMYIEKGEAKFQEVRMKFQAKANQYMTKVRETYHSVRKVHGGRMAEPLAKKSKIKRSPMDREQMIEKKMKIKENLKILQSQVVVQPSSAHQISQFKANPLHNKLNIVKQLRTYGLQNLDQYKISFRRGVKHQNLIELKYLQGANFNNPMCRQARGIILDENRNYEIAALPYYKFFDYNDSKYSQLKQFNFNDYKIYQKYDGSIAFMYFYQNMWHVASSSVPDGQSPYCFARKQTTCEFRKQFWRIFSNVMKYELPLQEDQNKTFIFELLSKNHIIVVNRQSDQLVLHGVRSIEDLQQKNHLQFGSKYGWKCSQPVELKLTNPLSPIQQLVAITQQLDPLKQEGFILCDKEFTRIKIKNSNYLRINWLGELNITKNKDPSKYILIQIVLAGESDTFVKYCPEWVNVIKQFCNKINKLNEIVTQKYEQIKQLEEKQFVNQVKLQEEWMKHFLFVLRRKYNLYKGRLQYSMLPKKFYQFITRWNP